MVGEILIILLLVLVNAVFAGSEIAIVSLRKTRLAELVASGRGGARAVQDLRRHPERFLATVQIGITVVGASASAFGGSNLAAEIEPQLARIPWLAPHAHQLALGVVVAAISYLSLVLGELVPKSLALRAHERYALTVGRPLLMVSALARPLVWLLTASSNLVLRMFGDQTSFLEGRVSVDELQQMVLEASTRGGSLAPTAGRIVTRALELGELCVLDVMVPRSRVVSLPLDASFEMVKDEVGRSMHTRYPLWEGTSDNVVGYVSVKDLLFLTWDPTLLILRDLLRKVHFVPETKRAVDLLEEMRTQRLTMAVIVDEHGIMSGIVTMEDLVEEVVGDIFGEYDLPSSEHLRQEPSGAILVRGDATVRELNREFALALPEDGDWTTIAGLCLALAGRIPDNGERIATPNGPVLEIADASAHRVRLVRVWPRAAAAS